MVLSAGSCTRAVARRRPEGGCLGGLAYGPSRAYPARMHAARQRRRCRSSALPLGCSGAAVATRSWRTRMPGKAVHCRARSGGRAGASRCSGAPDGLNTCRSDDVIGVPRGLGLGCASARCELLCAGASQFCAARGRQTAQAADRKVLAALAPKMSRVRGKRAYSLSIRPLHSVARPQSCKSASRTGDADRACAMGWFTCRIAAGVVANVALQAPQWPRHVSSSERQPRGRGAPWRSDNGSRTCRTRT